MTHSSELTSGAPGPFEPSSFDPGEWLQTTRALQRIARSIVGDAAQSEDIVQSVWARSLERQRERMYGEKGARQLPGIGWLRRAVRHRAIDVRREAVRRPVHSELFDTMPSGEEPADSEISRIETQRILLDAVEALDPPYRATLYMRYFEGIPVREVAARMGVPVKTVETRQARALVMLKGKLGPRLGNPKTGHWAPALVAFCSSSPTQLALPIPSATPFLASSLFAPLAGLVMKKLALAAIAIALLVAGWAAVDHFSANPSVTTDLAAGNALGPDVDADSTEVVETPLAVEGEPERAALGDPAPTAVPVVPSHRPLSNSGTLRVKVRWSDGAPAEGVGLVAVSPWAVPSGVVQYHREVSGVDGVALFAEIPPGKFRIKSDRALDAENGVPVEIRPGETTETAIRISSGIQVAGRVVDVSGHPVPGAGIWLTSETGRWTGGAIVAYADGGGNFRLRDLPEGPSLGALKPGYLRSRLVDLDLADKTVMPVEVELVVASGGGALEGVVTNAMGEPIEGAVVVIGDTRRMTDMRSDGTTKENWSARATTTDAEGRYRMDSLMAGTYPLRARRLGLAQSHHEVKVAAGEVARQGIVLSVGGEVRGTVTDSSGAPVVGARVQAFDVRLPEGYLQSGQIDYDGAFAQEVAITGADGSYQLGNLPRRKMFLYALGPRETRRSMDVLVQFTRGEVDLGAEVEHRWDAVLSDGPVISGNVRYADGEPIKNVFVLATSTGHEIPDRRALHTETGGFKFIQLPHASYTVSVQIWDLPEGGEEPRMTGVVPGGDPVELVANFNSPADNTDGTVRVRFLDAGERAPSDASVETMLESLDTHSWRNGDLVEGAWEFQMDAPGTYRPIALLGDRVIAVGEPFEFTVGADLDLGTFESKPGGTLVLHWEWSEEHPPAEAKLFLKHEGYRFGEDLELGNGRTLRLENLEPGTGSITVLGKNLVRVDAPFEVAAGEETVLTVSIEPAVGVPYRIELPELETATSFTSRFINTGDGSVAFESTLPDARQYPNPITWEMPLAPGDYRLEVELGDGRRADTTFTVLSLDPDEAPTATVSIR